MTNHICETCGTQHAGNREAPPIRCEICEDERQYVGWTGQQWTTHAELKDQYANRIEVDDGLLSFGITPAFGIDQRAVLLQTDAGNLLWECPSLVTDEAVAAIEARGGLDRIIISHPHFYASMVEWSEALGGVPILLHEADRHWVQRPHSAITFWRGDTLKLSESVTLIRAGGHFEGSTVLHWSRGPRGGALFTGDALQVVPTRRHVSFMYSYPNLIPMRGRDVQAMRDRLADYQFEDAYGYTWGRNIIGGARGAVDASFDRYLDAMDLPPAAAVVRGMRVLVLGASGNVGRNVAAEAVSRGHAVTGVVRRESALAELPVGVDGHMQDVTDSARLTEIIAEHDVVISALRPTDGRESLIVPLTQSVLRSAAEAQRRVLIVGGAANLLHPGASGHTVLSAPGFLPASSRPIAEASYAQYLACNAEQEADWVYFSPPAMLGAGERTGRYRRGHDTLLVDPDGESRISLQDFAVAMLDEVEQPTANIRRVTVAY